MLCANCQALSELKMVPEYELVGLHFTTDGWGSIGESGSPAGAACLRLSRGPIDDADRPHAAWFELKWQMRKGALTASGIIWLLQAWKRRSITRFESSRGCHRRKVIWRLRGNKCGGSQLLTGKSATIEGLLQWGGSFAAAALWLPQIFLLETMRDSHGVAAARPVRQAALLAAIDKCNTGPRASAPTPIVLE
ncbi:hypothetical protein Efla_006324 [Eimeria flavescens]